ncbi:MAG: hypothetical protein ACOCU4_08135 [Alkalispirochaeta sp.]
MVSIIGAAVVVCVGAGVGIGWSAWGDIEPTDPGELDRLEGVARELENELGRVQGNLEDAREQNQRLAERNSELERIVGTAVDRQRKVDEALGRAGRGLSDAGQDARGITERMERSIAIVDELFRILGEVDPIAGGGSEDGTEKRPP